MTLPLVGDVRSVPVEVLTRERIEEGCREVAVRDGARLCQRAGVNPVATLGWLIDQARWAHGDPVDIGRLLKDRFHAPHVVVGGAEEASEDRQRDAALEQRLFLPGSDGNRRDDGELGGSVRLHCPERVLDTDRVHVRGGARRSDAQCGDDGVRPVKRPRERIQVVNIGAAVSVRERLASARLDLEVCEPRGGGAELAAGEAGFLVVGVAVLDRNADDLARFLCV